MDYGLYICESCRDTPSDECGDACSIEFAGELPRVESDYWPRCSCCNREALIVSRLVAVGG